MAGASNDNPVEIAHKRRHLQLLEKVKSAEKLSAAEVKELEEYKDAFANQKKTNNREKSVVIDAAEVIKTQIEAAAYAGVSKRTIRRWRGAGMPQTKDGYYIKSMLDFFKAHQGEAPSGDRQREQKAQADLKTTKARLLELELAIKVGELVKKEVLEKERIARIQMVKRALLGLGRKVAPRAAKLRDPRKLAALINEQVREIIERFAK